MLVDSSPYLIIGIKGSAVSYLTRELRLDTPVVSAMLFHTVEQAEMVGRMLANQGVIDRYWVRPLSRQLAELN